MKLVVDTRGREVSPLLHLVAEDRGADGAVTRCSLIFRSPTCDRELSGHDLDHLCHSCAALAGVGVIRLVQK